jgi:DNA-binding transcriptional LysR family regulator
MDLNLLVILDHLLREESVTEAARRVGLSASAVSRALGRLRETTGDPLLVRAGRRLVLTARAEAMRGRVQALVEDAETTLRGTDAAPVATLARTFTIRSSDVVAALSVPLTAAVYAEAPHVQLRFVPEREHDVEALRDGRIQLEVGDLELRAPELRLQRLFRDRFIGVVRAGHPLSRGAVTAERFVRYPHVDIDGRGVSAIDRALRARGLRRHVPVAHPSHHAALAVAAQSDFVATVPRYLVEHMKGALAVDVFTLPFELRPVVIAQAWHPRFDKDPAHRWLRETMKAVCRPLAG